MRDRPDGLDDSALRRGLTAWGIDAIAVRYAPVGFGDHHWTASGADGRRWFATVADLDHKSHCGDGAEAAFRGLGRAMDTAAALRTGGLDFVVAPVAARTGETALRLDRRYALSVFPLFDSAPREFGATFPSAERHQVIAMLARLHRSAPPAPIPVLGPELEARPRLQAALDDAGRPWTGGPYAARAGELLADRATVLRRRLGEFDELVAAVAGTSPAPVVTHGEPHPGNLLLLADGHRLIDWDTVGLAAAERDLWSVATEPGDFARYVDAGGRAPDPAAMALYRLRWDLADLAECVGWFRAPHERTRDSAMMWSTLTEITDRLAGTDAA